MKCSCRQLCGWDVFFSATARLRALPGWGADSPTERLVRWTAVPYQLFMVVLKNKNQIKLTHRQLQNKHRPSGRCWGQRCLLTSLRTAAPTSPQAPTRGSAGGGSGVSPRTAAQECAKPILRKRSSTGPTREAAGTAIVYTLGVRSRSFGRKPETCHQCLLVV